MPTAYASCADCRVVFHLVVPLNAFSGTMTKSPGCNAERSAPLLNKPAAPPATDPSARITKIAFLLAVFVGPPACLKYQPASLPGLKVKIGRGSCRERV